MPVILALDQGTTSSRAIVFGHDGGMVAAAQTELTQIFPRAGWVEHDPREIWASQIGVAIEALDRAGLKPRDVAAIGISNQRETAIVWDRETGEPIHNAIVWQDRRTADVCEQLKRSGAAPIVLEKTGLLIDAYFSASKIDWLLTHVPGARERANAGRLVFGTVDTWLIWKLTGGRQHVTDVSNASRTMLFNIHTRQWDPALLRLFSVPEAMLPSVRSSSEAYGSASTSLGLGGAPIAGVAGDQQAALFGQLCREPGMSKNTYGTGCFLLQNVGTSPRPSRHQLVSTIAWQIGDRTEYALEGSVFIGGAVVQWIRDGLGLIRRTADIEPLASSVTDTGGVFFVPAFAGLGAPHWDPFARGALFGSDARDNGGAPGAGGARIDRLSGRGPARCNDGRLGRRAEGAARRRWRGRKQHADADAGGSARRAGGPAGGDGDNGARRSLSRRAGCRLLEIRR